MRIVGGEFRSRVLLSVPGLDTRPTTDRMRETLFNIIAPMIENAVFVDAYAGTGAVGIEAVSRGAKQAILIEKDRDAVEVIKANLGSLKITTRARIIRGSAPLHLASLNADIVFLDPPYTNENEYKAVFDVLSAKPPQLVIAQHSSRYAIGDQYDSLRRTRTVKQGDNSLSFFSSVRPVESHRLSGGQLSAAHSDPRE